MAVYGGSILLLNIIQEIKLYSGQIAMNVRNIFIRNIFIKIPTLILVLVVCFGITTHAVRAIATFSESETEKVDPQEEKKLYQRLNLSRLSRHTRIRNVIPFLVTEIESRPVDSTDYRAPSIYYQRNHKIPILRAPPSNIPI
jgi:hypothetical protein